MINNLFGVRGGDMPAHRNVKLSFLEWPLRVAPVGGTIFFVFLR